MTNDTAEYNQESQAEVVDEDEALILAAKEDVEAFGRLYDKYYKSIFRYIYHRTLDHTLTEDLTSNTFFAAFRHIGRYRWRRIPFSAWLYRIATNEIRMHLRKQKQLSSMDLDPASAGENMMVEEDYAALHQAILRLKPIYQAVITLRFFEEKTISEISKITGKKEGTVKSQLHRGIEKLRYVLERKGILSSEEGEING